MLKFVNLGFQMRQHQHEHHLARERPGGFLVQMGSSLSKFAVPPSVCVVSRDLNDGGGLQTRRGSDIMLNP